MVGQSSGVVTRTPFTCDSMIAWASRSARRPAVAGTGGGAPVGERGQQVVEVAVEGGVEVAVDVVEVAGLPHLAGLVAGRGEGVAAHRVLDQRPARRAR